MNTAFLDLAPFLRERLAQALETGVLRFDASDMALRSALGPGLTFDSLKTGLLEMQNLGLSSTAAATWLRSIDRILDRIKKPDLVWSGPEVPNLHARNTRRVYEELLGSATRSLWASTYAFFDGPKAFDILARRMEAIPGLKVTLLLNIQRKKGDEAPPDQVVRRFADRFWKSDWPGKYRPKVWFDPRALEPDRRHGVLHVKAVVCDEEVVYITSANLTESALDKNIELGLLVRDPAMAVSVASHFQTLIDKGLLSPLPES